MRILASKELPSPFLLARIRVHFILQNTLGWVILSHCPLCILICKSHLVAFPQTACYNWKFPLFLFKNPDSIFSFNFLLKIFSMSKGYKQSHKCPLILVGLHLGLSACLLPLLVADHVIALGSLPAWLLSRGLTVGGLQEPRQGLAHIDSLLQGSAHCSQVISCSVYMYKLLSRAGSLKISGEIPVWKKLGACASSVCLLIYGENICMFYYIKIYIFYKAYMICNF